MKDIILNIFSKISYLKKYLVDMYGIYKLGDIGYKPHRLPGGGISIPLGGEEERDKFLSRKLNTSRQINNIYLIYCGVLALIFLFIFLINLFK